ncbi:MAG TPA: cation:proton antiporter [Gemmatimonadales bacterium]|nr:cation:proton antiporter [Gemmatimonadales bacterium]
MPTSHESFTGALALIGLVILVSSLLSGAVERSGIPQVAIFLLLGALLGPHGLNLVELSLQSSALEIIATLGLMLVLFSDAIGLDVAEVREQRRLATLILGPGTLLPAAVIALAAWWLLGLPAPAAAILGAALASTDPVLLRTLVRHSALPQSARLGLRLESGMNDVILLPIVVLSMLALRAGGPAPAWEVGSRAVGLFLLGPALGAFSGWAGISLLDQVRRRVGVRRDYESLYALGVAFTAFAAAEAMGGSGFLAAFAAGLVIAALDVELCDCFLDYGEASAEMFLLLTFVAFGAGLIWTGLAQANARTLLFAAVALFARTVVLIPVLRLARLDPGACRIIAWFGPRGLSSLLLVLLPVFDGVPGAEQLFAITCLVVLLSVVVHGGGIAWFLGRVRKGGEGARGLGGREGASVTGAGTEPMPAGSLEARPASAAQPPGHLAALPAGERISIPEMLALQAAGQPLVLLDVRTERSYRDSAKMAAGAIRFPPDDAVRLARERGLDREAILALYCT